MRTIKFRGKGVFTDAWRYGDLVHNQKVTTTGLKPRTMVGVYEVDPSTIGQYTGLKDKNGKEIYEGDVLRSDEYPYSNLRYEECDNYFAVLYYCKNAASFLIQKIKNPKTRIGGLSDDFSDYITQKEISDFEVIGNIHEDEWKQYRKYFSD